MPCGFASVQSIKMHPLICHADPRAFRRANTRIEIAPPNMCKLMPRLQKRHQSLRIYIAIFLPVKKNTPSFPLANKGLRPLFTVSKNTVNSYHLRTKNVKPQDKDRLKGGRYEL